MHEKYRDELSKILAQAENRRELETLLEGLLTPGEIQEAVFRWRLMKRLLRGDTHRKISADLGVSLGKIARGSRLLKYGPEEFRELVERFKVE